VSGVDSSIITRCHLCAVVSLRAATFTPAHLSGGQAPSSLLRGSSAKQRASEPCFCGTPSVQEGPPATGGWGLLAIVRRTGAEQSFEGKSAKQRASEPCFCGTPSVKEGPPATGGGSLLAIVSHLMWEWLTGVFGSGVPILGLSLESTAVKKIVETAKSETT